MSSTQTVAPAVRIPVGGVLTPRMERMIRLGSVGSALVIAVSAMVLSYAGLHDLALDAHIHPRLALLVPIMVDGLQFVGSLGVVYSTLSGLRAGYPWLLMLMGVSISAWGNWQAAPADLTAKLLHAAAPIILALVLEELLRVMRHKVHLHALAHSEPSPESSPESGAAPLTQVAAATAVAESAVAESAAEADDMPVAAPQAPAKAPSLDAQPGVTRDVSPDPQVEAKPENPQPQVESEGPEGDVAMDADLPVPGLNSPASIPAQAALAIDAQALPAGPRDASVARAADSATSPPRSHVRTEADEDAEVDSLPPYPAQATFKEQVKAILAADPTTPAALIARVMGKDPSYTRKTVREARGELDAEREASARPVEPVVPARAEVSGAGAVGDDLDDADPFALRAPERAPAYATR